MNSQPIEAALDFQGAISFASTNPRIQSLLMRLKVSDNGCWEWLGRLNEKGYARVGYKRKNWLLHRLVCLFFNGLEDSDLCALHKCDNPICSNPNHLFLGTQIQNIQDRNRKGRTSYGPTQPNAKLTVEIVSESRKACAAGETVTSLANRFGVNRTTLYFAVIGAKWPNVSVPPCKNIRSSRTQI